MELQRRARPCCRCTRYLPFSSALLFLSSVLPASSFAQLPGEPTQTTSFQTSTAPASATSIPPPSQAQSNPPTTNNTTNDSISSKSFNYYFVIVAVAAVLFVGCIFYIGRRKKRKAALLRAHSQRALAQDVAGFRTRSRRTGAGWGWPGNPMHNPHRDEATEGLDERGEAPPPYVPGSKPPSIRTNDGIVRMGSSRSVERRASTEVDVELGDMTRPRYAPPGYCETQNVESGDATAGITRPDAAVTPQERFGSSRRLLGSTDRSSEA